MNFYIKDFCSHITSSVTILDLGCGEGNSIDFFKSISESINWHGVDIEDSPEVRKRSHNHESILTFDGINLPFLMKTLTQFIAIMYSSMYVSPDALIADAFRVLKPNGMFVGTVSYLEPYHSYSIFNFTPYGVARIFTDAGFLLEEIRPGADALHLIIRQLLNRSKKLHCLWKRNYLHGMLELVGSFFRLGHRERNFLGSPVFWASDFLAKRPANAGKQND